MREDGDITAFDYSEGKVARQAELPEYDANAEDAVTLLLPTGEATPRGATVFLHTKQPRLQSSNSVAYPIIRFGATYLPS